MNGKYRKYSKNEEQFFLIGQLLCHWIIKADQCENRLVMILYGNKGND